MNRVTCLWVFVFSYSVCAVPEFVSACSCIQDTLNLEGKVKVAAFRADEVFLGRVMSSSTEGNNALFSVEVKNIWKGQPPRNVVVATPQHSSMCGVSLQVNEQYVFYGRLEPAGKQKGYRFTLNICDRAAVREVEKEREMLDRIDIKKLTAEEIEKLEQSRSPHRSTTATHM